MVELSDDIPTITASYPNDYPDSCAMLIDVRDNRIVNVRGNRAYTFTLGVFEALAAISEYTRLGVVVALLFERKPVRKHREFSALRRYGSRTDFLRYCD